MASKTYVKRNTKWLVEINLHCLELDCRFLTSNIKEYIIELELSVPITAKKEEFWKHISVLDLAYGNDEILNVIKFLEHKSKVSCKNSLESEERGMKQHEIRWSVL